MTGFEPNMTPLLYIVFAAGLLAGFMAGFTFGWSLP